MQRATLILFLIQLYLLQNSMVFAQNNATNSTVITGEQSETFSSKSMLMAFLEAYNNPDKKVLQAFNKTYISQTKDYLSKIYYDLGPLKLVSVEKEVDDYIVVWLKGTVTNGWTKLNLTLNEAKNRIKDISITKGDRPKEVVFPKLTKSELKSHLDDYFLNMERLDLFSGSVLIMQKGRTIFDGAYGMANREANVKNTSYTSYQITSISKLFAMVAIAQLDEQGKLSIPEPISTIIPEYPEQMSITVTYKHLLAHTSGITLNHIKDYELSIQKTTSLEGLLKTQLKYIDQIDNFNNWTPKERFDYSNEGYDLLALIVQRASGIPYEDYLEQYIFRPAQMYNSGPYIYNSAKKDQAISYTHYADWNKVFNPEKWLDNTFFLDAYARPSDGYKSTTLDLYKFINAASNGTLLSKDTWEALSKEAIVKIDQPFLYKGHGLGIARENLFNTGLSLGHVGNFPGVSARLKMYPESETVVVILSNRDNGSLNADAYIRDLLANMKSR